MNPKSIVCYVIGIICGAIVIGIGVYTLLFKDIFGLFIVIAGICLLTLSTGMFWLETKLR